MPPQFNTKTVKIPAPALRGHQVTIFSKQGDTDISFVKMAKDARRPRREHEATSSNTQHRDVKRPKEEPADRTDPAKRLINLARIASLWRIAEENTPPGRVSLVPQRRYDERETPIDPAELHSRPTEILPGHGVQFDIFGCPPRTGIRLSLLDNAHFDDTKQAILDAEKPVQLWDCDGCTRTVLFHISWPAHPKAWLRHGILIDPIVRQCMTVAELTREVAKHMQRFIETCRAEESVPEFRHFSLAKGGLDPNKIWLVSFYQVEGVDYQAEFMVLDDPTLLAPA